MDKFEEIWDLIARLKSGDLFLDARSLEVEINALYDAGELAKYQWRNLRTYLTRCKDEAQQQG